MVLHNAGKRRNCVTGTNKSISFNNKLYALNDRNRRLRIAEKLFSRDWICIGIMNANVKLD